MIFATLTLNDGEWQRVRGAAMNYWPNEPLERQLSKNEACRRLLMGGITSLQSTSQSNQQQMAQTYSRPIQPPGDTNIGPRRAGGAKVSPTVAPQNHARSNPYV